MFSRRATMLICKHNRRCLFANRAVTFDRNLEFYNLPKTCCLKVSQKTIQNIAYTATQLWSIFTYEFSPTSVTEIYGLAAVSPALLLQIATFVDRNVTEVTIGCVSNLSIDELPFRSSLFLNRNLRVFCLFMVKICFFSSLSLKFKCQILTNEGALL